MTSTATILLLALGAAAEVPHWVQKKQQPSFKMPVLPVFSMQSRLLQQIQNSRRLDGHETGIMSKGCQEACPGVMDFIKAMMEAGATRRRLDGHEGDGGMSPEMMNMMCEHLDTLKCTGETEACKDPNDTEEDKDGAANLACMCKCPKLVEAMSAGEKAMEMMCKDKAGTVGCVTSAAECSAMKSEINEKEYDLGCAWNAKGCEEKSNGMATCVGAEDMGTWGTTKCDTADGIKANADTCCPIGKKLVDCMTPDCITLSEAMQKASGETSDGSMAASREACPDAGLPSAAAVDAAATSGTLDAPAASGESADFAAPGQSVSMLAMGLVMVASLIA